MIRYDARYDQAMSPLTQRLTAIVLTCTVAFVAWAIISEIAGTGWANQTQSMHMSNLFVLAALPWAMVIAFRLFRRRGTSDPLMPPAAMIGLGIFMAAGSVGLSILAMTEREPFGILENIEGFVLAVTAIGFGIRIIKRARRRNG
jgi:cytochrome bd-type quinol oxidase subunit 2